MEIFIWIIIISIFLVSAIGIVSNILTIKNMKNDKTLEKKEKSKKINSAIIKITISFIIAFLCFYICVTMEQISSVVDKPLIYLYPEKEETVTVNLGRPKNLTCTYPKYINNWEVIAKPDGNLTDVKTGRNLYGLYWEGKNTIDINEKEGFCVKGEDTIKFLEEKLAILGLNEREANEFIIYWLPKLEKNKYNFIRFEDTEKIEENMPLNISPKPDTVIRVLMEYKPLKNYKEVQEQKLTSPERQGFTVVEWGGTQINSRTIN